MTEQTMKPLSADYLCGYAEGLAETERAMAQVIEGLRAHCANRRQAGRSLDLLKRMTERHEARFGERNSPQAVPLTA